MSAYLARLDTASMSAYERKRQSNIERNQAKLEELKLTQQKAALAATQFVTPRKKSGPQERVDYGAPKLTRGAARRAGFSLGEGGAQLELPDDEESEDEEDQQLALDTSRIVAKLREAAPPVEEDAPASAEVLAAAREAFKQMYCRIKGGTYEEWGVQKTVKEGGRADYASKTFVKAHFGRPDKDNKKRQLALNDVAKLTPGHLPHMPNGTAFYSRAEMEAVGFHSKQMNGIDYCSAKNSRYLDPEGNGLSYALTIVSAGGYEDDDESPDGEWLWYTGEGKNDLNSSRRQQGNQTMKGGNEALLNSHRLGLPVRLARYVGQEERDSFSGRKFIYDGLYDVAEVKHERGVQGYTVIKFLFVRQVNKANGKLRKEAVAPRHGRIIQLGMRDGSLEKREQLHSAELAATKSKLKARAGPAASEPAGKRSRRRK